MESPGRKDELKEELDSIEKMTVYERLKYIRDLAKFQKSMYPDDHDQFFVDRVLLVTKGY